MWGVSYWGVSYWGTSYWGKLGGAGPIITGGVLVTGIITQPQPVVTIDVNGKYATQVNAVMKTSSVNSVNKTTRVNSRINKTRVK